MVQLGRSLAVPICAEGVETAGQLAQLRDEGCQEAQGFLFAHPMPAAEIAALTAAWPATSRSAGAAPRASRSSRRDAATAEVA